MSERSRVLILDFGGQYNLLIARRVRERGVYCEIKPYNISMEEIRQFAPSGIIFTGGPSTVYEEGAPKCDPAVFELGVPVLGICYGQQLMTLMLGGTCKAGTVREYGKAELLHNSSSLLFEGVRQQSVCWMSHTISVDQLPEGFITSAKTKDCPTAAIENPGYRRVRTILENSDLPCRGVSIDEGGLSVSALEESGANLCCVTPSHHFPTGVTMPAGRRSQLLRWATAQQGRYIIEDDYDAEFRFDIRPLPSLQGLGGQNGPVIYLSTFSKSLAPSIRIACMVLPPELLERYRSTYGTYANTVSRFEQQTLCRFLRDGYFTRHLSRMRSAYKARMEALCAALEHTFGRERLTLQGRHNGLHLLLTLRDGPGEGAMVRRAMEEGVKLTGLSTYYLEGAEGCPENTVVLGYAGLADDDIPDLAAALGRAWGT